MPNEWPTGDELIRISKALGGDETEGESILVNAEKFVAIEIGGVPPATPAANKLYKHPNAGGQLVTAIDASSAEAAIAGVLDATQGGISTGALEDWHEIGATDEPAFQNSWRHFDASDVGRNASFRKLPTGEVYIKGLISAGTMTLRAFTMPVGYRPLGSITFVVRANNLLGIVRIHPNGDVLPDVGVNVFFEIGCSFIAEQ